MFFLDHAKPDSHTPRHKRDLRGGTMQDPVSQGFYLGVAYSATTNGYQTPWLRSRGKRLFKVPTGVPLGHKRHRLNPTYLGAR